jgi:CRP-like cAMP-binding protein
MSQIRTVRKRQVILYNGEATIHVYVVRKGIVRAYTLLNNGAEVIIALFGPGDYFPVNFDRSKAPVSLFYYETMNEGSVETFTVTEFKSYIDELDSEEDASNRRYLSSLLHINALVQMSTLEKLSHMLRYLSLRFGAPLVGKTFTRIQLKLTQQDLANLCNMSRETTNIELSKLKEKRIITEKAKLYSVNMKELNKLINDDIDETLHI